MRSATSGPVRGSSTAHANSPPSRYSQPWARLPFMTIHAGYALNIGVSEEELKQVVYMVTVPAGFPRAIAASQAISELFTERRAAPGKHP